LREVETELLNIMQMKFSYNKSQQDAILNFILVKNATFFGKIYCLSSGVLILYSQK